MRFRSIAVVTLLSLSAAATGRAQAAADPQCVAAPMLARDACQQAVDLFQYMAPQLGISITGGNPTLGVGGSLGGLGHFSIGVRGNLVQGHVPEIQSPSLTGIQQRTDYPVTSQILGLPAVDVAVGLFKGIPLALSNVGGIDALVTAMYVPKYDGDEVDVTPDKELEFGYGVRVGVLQESLLMPGIGVSYMIRKIPTTTVVGSLTGTTLTLEDLAVETKSWRITASKSLLLFTIAAGVGQDQYDMSAAVSANANATNAGPFNVSQDMTRTNYFGDVQLNLLMFKIVGEVGMTSGGEAPTHNTFTTAADASRMYGSVGVRFGF